MCGNIATKQKPKKKCAFRYINLLPDREALSYLGVKLEPIDMYPIIPVNALMTRQKPC